jgi:hypothetical protein
VLQCRLSALAGALGTHPHPLLRVRAPSPQTAERLEFEARKEEMKARAMRASGLFKFTG